MLRHVDPNNHHAPRLKGFIRELTLRARRRAIAWRAKVRRRNKSLGTYLQVPISPILGLIGAPLGGTGLIKMLSKSQQTFRCLSKSLETHSRP